MKNKYYINSRLFQPSGCLTSEAMEQYLCGDLFGKEKHMVEQHLEECPLCSDAVEGLNMLGEQQRESADSDITRNIARRTGSKGIAQPVLHRQNNVYKYVAAVAALVILIGSVYWYQSGVGEDARFIAATEQEEHIEKKSVQEKQVEKEEPIVPSASAQKENEPETQDVHVTSEAEIQEQSTRLKKTEIPGNENHASSSYRSGISRNAIAYKKGTIEDAANKKSISETESDEDEISESKNKSQAPPPSEEVELNIVNNEVLLSDAIDTESTFDADTGNISEPAAKRKAKNSYFTFEKEPVYDRVYIIVEDMPEFKDEGKEAFRQYIAEHLRYPVEAEKKGIEGKVYVHFIVTKNGTVDDVKVIRGVHPLLDKEAVRVIKSSPDWKPGKQRGEPVNVKFTIPVSFSLKK